MLVTCGSEQWARRGVVKSAVVARVGAAVFVAGVSLGGAVPVAVADEGDGGSAAEVGSEKPGSSRPPARAGERNSVGPPRRGAAGEPAAEVVDEPAGVAGAGRVRGAVRGADIRDVEVVAPVEGAGERTGARQVPDSVAAPAAAVAPAVTPVGDPVGLPVGESVSGVVLAPAPVATIPVGVSGGAGPAAAVVDRCPNCWVVGPPVNAPMLTQSLGALSAGVGRVIDTVGQWLSGLSANPFTDFVSGALWLVRRSLFPVGADVGLWGSAGCVATKDCSGRDLTGARLTDLVLADVNFTDTILEQADLSRSNAATARMDGANLTGALLVRTVLTGAGLSGADLYGANLRSAILDRADFTGADLRVLNMPMDARTGIGASRSLSGANLSGLNLTGVDFTGRDLAGVDFTGAILTNAILSDTVLTQADLRGADLAGARLDGVSDADLVSARWAGANLAGQNFAGRNLSFIDWAGVDLSGAVLTEVNLSRADLTEAILTGVSDADLVSATWNGTTLTGVTLRGRNLAGIKLPEAILTSADLTSTVLTDAVLNRADLRGAILAGVTDADLVSADLRGAILAEQNLSLRRLTGIDLTDADLTNAILTRSLMGKAILVDAKLGGADLKGTFLFEADLTNAVLTNAKLHHIGAFDDPGALVTDLSKAILTNAVLEGADLRRAILTATTLTGARLTDADLRGAALSGLSDADLVSATWTDADLSGQNLSGRRLAGIVLAGVDLTGARLTGSDLSQADLTGATLAGVTDADLVSVTWNGAILRGADLSNRNLAGIKLPGVNLFGADLRGTTLTQAELSAADLRQAKLAGARLGGARLAKTDFRGTDLRGVILAGVSDANLVSADLRGTKLGGQNLSGRNLSGVQLANADLQGTILTGVNLSGADLYKADLRGANLNGVTNFGTATLTGANLSGQPLIRLDLSDKDLTDTNFSGAILTGTDLSGAILRGAILRDAKLVGANLSGAALGQADLYRANLRDANLDSATNIRSAKNFDRIISLVGVDLSNTDLRGMEFVGRLDGTGNLSGASFENADLAAAEFIRADLTNATLYRADLTGTRFVDVVFRNTTCPDGSKTDTGCSSAGAAVAGTEVARDPARIERIEENPDFSYADAMAASQFAELAYQWRDNKKFSLLVDFSGWQGITVDPADRAAGGFSPAAGGYGVRGQQDGITVNSYAFAGRRTAADGTVQFVLAVEGSNPPLQEPADWVANVAALGWSRYWASLQPLMVEVIDQMVAARQGGSPVQLILTGHSLGGATAMIGYADLLAPRGNLYPDTDKIRGNEVLGDGQRIWDRVGTWDPATRQAILDATTVYTYGAPSPLIDPLKLPARAAERWVNDTLVVAMSPFPLTAIGPALPMLAKLLSVLGEVPDSALPLPFRSDVDSGARDRIFQFEHLPRAYNTPDGDAPWGRRPTPQADSVPALGDRDPGTLLQVVLDPPVYDRYGGGIPHGVDLYAESVLRLMTDSQLLWPYQVRHPELWKAGRYYPELRRTPAGQGSARNDFFTDSGGQGKGGNDVFAFTRPGSYTVDGGAGSDAYTINGFGITLTLDGSVGSGRDSVIFTLPATRALQVTPTVRPGFGVDVVLTSRAMNGPGSSTVTIRNWDEWALSDVYASRQNLTGRRWELGDFPILLRYDTEAAVGPVS
ncbi:MAG: hypothetical protein FGM52_03050 [Mycobacterium sp.]|nr:hypothetical protein [Mycobacterium sp.]